MPNDKTQTTLEKLMPCPFCGTRAYVEDASNFLGDYRGKPMCDNPECVTHSSYETIEKAIEAWNERHN